MREKTCCFTGHRRIPVEDRERLADKLVEIIEELIQRGIRYFGAGGALGFDTLAARTVLLLREAHPEIRLIFVLPCPTQTRNWREEDIAIYEEIKAQADKVVYTSQTYDRGCMHRRNRHLVDNSKICVCCLTEDTGGTAYTVRYARSQGLEIINIAP